METTMPFSRSVVSLLSGLIAVGLASQISSTGRAQTAEASRAEAVELRVRLAGPSLMMVPVYLNGHGPYDFVLDTGSTITTVDAALAAEVGLSRTGQTAIASLQGGESVIETSMTASVVVGGMEVRRLTVGLAKRVDGMPVRARGVLGEDFLRQFDVLLDYDHSRLTLMTAAAGEQQRMCGEHVLFVWPGEGAAGNRLIVETALPWQRQRARLLLDTGTNVMVLLSAKSGLRPAGLEAVRVSGNAVSRERSMLGGRVGRAHVRLGVVEVELDVLSLMESAGTEAGLEGMLPPSAFHAVFISHSGGVRDLQSCGADGGAGGVLHDAQDEALKARQRTRLYRQTQNSIMVAEQMAAFISKCSS
jgi:hypothetical protein